MYGEVSKYCYLFGEYFVLEGIFWVMFVMFLFLGGL